MAEGNPDAAFFLACRFIFGSNERNEVDVTKAVGLFSESACLGNAVAYHNLGIYYESGFGFGQEIVDFVPDHQKALSMFLEAAKRNVPTSVGKVGSYYFEGFGVIQNFREAITWLSKGAHYGDRLSLYLLGAMNEEGMGLPIDMVKALTYYNLGATYGNSGTAFKGEDVKLLCVTGRDRLNRSLTLEQVTEAQSRALEFSPKPFPKFFLS
jgi:TPR repeat protein